MGLNLSFIKPKRIEDIRKESSNVEQKIKTSNISFKKIKKSNEIRRESSRDSYKDRICDDLSEVILQYLSIEDKFRFECVSKQFQRTVFQKEYDLNLNRLSILQKMSNSKAIKKLVKKLPNLLSLTSNYTPLNDSDIDIITKYWNKLTKINVDLSEISITLAQNWSQFVF